MKRIITALVFVVCSMSAYAQVVINEVSSENFTALADNDGDFEDWIELYNAGGASVNLSGYQITDTTLAVTSWTFPNVTIGAGEYLTLYASGKDRFDYIDHWESIVKEDDSWQYTIPTSEPATDWTSIAFADGGWSTGIGGIGMGDGDDNTIVPGGTESVYMRRSFNVVDSSEIEEMIFHMDFDDGFVAYLNGVEIARENVSGDPPAFDDFANSNDEAVLYTAGMPSEYILDKSVWQPLIVNGTNVLAIQVHNVSSTSTDLSARPWLEVGVSTATVNYSTIPAWFTPVGSSVYLHTNFKLSNNGETITLYNAGSTQIDQVTLPELHDDITFGRSPNGSGGFTYLYPATPNANNGTSTTYSGIWEDTVSFSLPAGFYTTGQSTGCTCGSGLSTVRYTTDGSKPNSSSTAMGGSISIPSTRVIRAGCFRSGYITKNSKIETNSYFIVDNHDLPVVSISVLDDDFFDYNTGIYELGPNANAAEPNYGANFWEDWEREIHIEYFDESDVQDFEQDCGVKIFGGWSRAQDMKSLRLIARDQYGKDHFDYTFSDKPNVKEHDQLVLRNSGNDFRTTQFRDGLNHTLQVGNDNMDIMAYQPTVVYINGQYWGIHNLRERVNPEYVEANHGVDHKDVNFMEFDDIVKQGSGDSFFTLTNFVENNDMTIQSNYDQVKDMLDIENFVDYFAIQTYHQNGDWPHNNIRYWSSPETGNKWRYIYFDTDFGLNMWGNFPAYDDELDRVIDAIDNPHSIMLKKLLTNEEFKCYFVNRYADLMNTTLLPSNYKGTCDALAAKIASEISDFHDRWPGWPDASMWPGNVDHIKDYMDDRPSYARDHIEGQFGSVTNQHTVTLDVNPPGAGVVKISTVVPDTYPWSGVYFQGCPVVITAYPNEGYEFANWSVTGASISTGNISNSVSLTQNASFTANFNVTSNIPLITINEINYNSSAAYEADDWIELYNHGTASADLSGWVFKDANDFNAFIIPDGTTLGIGEYIVIFRDDSTFSAQHPSVNNKLGPFDFKLSNGGERLRLYNSIGVLKVDMTYNDLAPWPTAADGGGFTLELSDPTGDLNDPANWFTGCVGGSPGGPYVQCPCLPVDLGANDYLCLSGGSKTLTSGLAGPHTNRTFQWFRNGSPVGTNSTLNVILSGTYSLQVDSLGCVQTDEVDINDDFSADLGGDVELCSPATYTFATGLTNPSINFTWRKDAVIIGGETNPQLTVTSPGTYEVTASGGSCTNSVDVAVVTSAAAVPDHDTLCEPGGVFNLAVTGPSNYDWYDDATAGSLVTSGNTFVTSNLTTTTTYYVEDADFFNGTVGPADPNEPGGDVWTNDDFDNQGYKLKFNVQQDLVLDAVWVDADGPQDVTINVSTGPDAGSLTTIHSKTVSITSGGFQRIPLGFQLTTASGLWIDAVGTTGELAMSGNTGTAWGPSNRYEAPGYLDIYRTEPDWADDQGWFFYLYNWEFSSGPGPCDRVPVVAYVENCNTVSADFTADVTTICEGSTVTFTDNSTGATTWDWNFGAGSFPSTASGQGPHTVTFVTSGAKNIQLTAGDGVDTDIANKSAYISVDAGPTTASAGLDQTICATSIVLPGNTPSVGSGNWSLITGSGNIVSSTNPNTSVNNLGVGGNTFRWTISNGVCPSSTDDITITRDAAPSAADAGTAQDVCATSTPLAGNTPGSGTGTWSVISGNGTFTNSSSPTSTVNGLNVGVNTFRWTISTGGSCANETDDVVITRSEPPTVANAGSNQTVCGTTATLNGNTATVGTGQWSLVSGTGTITNASLRNSTVTGLGVGDNIFQWTITNGSCSPSTDVVTISQDENPSTASAGGDQVLCSGSTTVTGNTPSVGTGLWEVISGSGTFTNANNASTNISGLASGSNVLRWTISNGVCPSSSDEVEVTREFQPSLANAGADQNICSGSTVLAATTPAIGSGAWSIVSGTGVVDDPTNPNSTVSGIAVGTLVLEWVVSNGSCPSNSDQVQIVRTSGAAASVSLTPNSPNVCQGSNVTFTALPVNGGSTPTYEWFVNNSSQGAGSSNSLLLTAPNNSDQVYVVMTSSLGCATGSPATSTTATVTVDQQPTPADAGADQNICGSTTTINANTPSVGTGIWSVVVGPANINNVNNASTTVSGINTGTVTLRWTVSNGSCPSSSDDIDIVSSTSQVVTSSISVDKNPICNGDVVTFSSTNTNIGSSPSYQWLVNGTDVNNNNATLVTSSINDGDPVQLIVTSSETCVTGNPASSNVINMMKETANSISSITGPSVVECGDLSEIFGVNSAVGSVYNWNVPSFLTINSGQGSASIDVSVSNQFATGNISVQERTSGGCFGSLFSKSVSSDCVNGLSFNESIQVSLYPNPFVTTTTLLVTGTSSSEYVYAVYDISGRIIDHGSGERGVQLQFGRDMVGGVYQLLISTDDAVFVEKFIKE